MRPVDRRPFTSLSFLVPLACASALGCSDAATGGGETSSSASQAASVGDRLTGGQILNPGDELDSSNGQYRLVMQTDGNLVEYWGSRVMWATGTSGDDGAFAMLTQDGELEIIRIEGVHDTQVVLWSTGKTGGSNPALVLQTDSNTVITDDGVVLWNSGRKNQELLPGQTLTAGQFIASPSDTYKLEMQDDGNAVLSHLGGSPVWATGTNGTGANRITMQTDGNLVVYGAPTPWSTGTNGQDGAHLDVEDDGTIDVITTSGQVAWMSGCAGKTGYCDPLRATANPGQSRVDQGVDYCGSGPVFALGMGKVVAVMGYNSAWGGGILTYELTAGPAKGDYVYFAEDFTPSLSVGDPVDVKTVIGTMGESCIETGWADSSPGYYFVPLAQYYPVGPYPSSAPSTALGVNFNDLLKSVGTRVPGRVDSAIYGYLPNPWPTW